MSTQSFTVRVPASTSNLGSGFDTVSAALALYLTVEVECTDSGAVEWVQGAERTRRFPDQDNLVAISLERALQYLGRKPSGLRIRMHNPIPVQRGLGSSAAAIITGIKIAETVFGCRLQKDEIFQIAYPLEGHPDNLAASLLGGWVLSWVGGERMNVARLSSNLEARFVLAVPEITVSTRQARAILPSHYSLSDATYNLQRCALLIHALYTGQKNLLSEATSDRLHQPFRSQLVPGMTQLLDREKLSGELAEAVLAVCISGSGSAMIALVESHFDEIGQWMAGIFSAHGVGASYLVLDLDREGARVW